MTHRSTDNPTALNDMIRAHHWWPAFQAACPGWEVFFCRMRKDEILDYNRKVIWLRARLPDPLFRWSHATAHVMDNPDGMAAIGPDDELSADLAAECWAAYSPPHQVQGSSMSEVA